MTKTISNFAKIYICMNLLVIFFCILANNYLWLLNTQVAFISSMAITIGSFLAYKKKVSLKSKDEFLATNKDELDKIDDPYDLYDDEINEQESFTKEEIKEIIKEQKEKIKQNTFKNLANTTSSFLSPFRLTGYIILIIGFFALINNELFEAYSYIGGLLIVPISTLLASLKS